MRSTSRAARVSKRTHHAAAAAAALMVTIAAEADARADEKPCWSAVAGVSVAFMGADIAFAVSGLAGATDGRLAHDGWLVAEAIVCAPQMLFFNGMAVYFNVQDDWLWSDIANFVGILPIAGVTALTTH